MKKSIPFALAAMLAFSLAAEEEKPANEQIKQPESVEKADSTVWPAYFAVSQWPRSVDVVGLRLTIPFSTAQESVTGLDVGLWGKSVYFEGIQLNVLRNDVTDGGTGIQVGIYNSVGSDELMGIQAGLWNEALSLGGVQVGLVNVVGEARGFQIGLVNRAETFYGYQVGLINVIRDAEVRFCPFVNIGF